MSDAPRWTIHLPTRLTDIEAAARFAAALRDSLAHLDVVDFADTTLSATDQPLLRTRVWGDVDPDPAGGDPGSDRTAQADD
ncbi:hypothetical protein O7608_01935 [Solwaraspora sp. WMMA2056]|uniref:hypothetical protein n=1 Tax=Solwaraspora sp. WMMA2056 TaxID=3015161 RepID=UPI00259AFD9E|nr:hypothetical protein [Solwaraspora sp. WMMA2056]WJK41235.1 hypothetical protein O7608_01935 [Solwaraspora sp. WMMA2056]